LTRFLAAIRFLTVLPLPGERGAAGPDLAGSVPFFPVVGMLLGAVAAASSWAVSLAAPPLLAGAAVVILLVAFSGGMHMDGLSDTADGFLSAQPREKVLEIMRDSRAGPMGVTAVACVLLVKFASVASLPGFRFPQAVFLMPLAGRCALVVHMALLPYLRQNGIGTIFQGNCPRLSAVWAAAVMALAGWAALGLAGLAAAGMCLAASLAFACWCHRRIGGATGDTCGAACEIVEAVPAAVLAVWPG